MVNSVVYSMCTERTSTGLVIHVTEGRIERRARASIEAQHRSIHNTKGQERPWVETRAFHGEQQVEKAFCFFPLREQKPNLDSGGTTEISQSVRFISSFFLYFAATTTRQVMVWLFSVWMTRRYGSRQDRDRIERGSSFIKYDGLQGESLAIDRLRVADCGKAFGHFCSSQTDVQAKFNPEDGSKNNVSKFVQMRNLLVRD